MTEPIAGFAARRKRPLAGAFAVSWLQCLMFSLLSAWAHVAASAAAAMPLQVFVSIAPEKTFVTRIGGNRVRVSVMVPPGSSPATYEPTPRQMIALTGSVLYFRIGMPFENSWMQRIRSTNPALGVVDLRAGIPLRRFEGHHHEVVNPEHGLLDPHIWTNPRLVITMAAHIRDALTRLDPPGKTGYAANYAAYAAELRALDARIRSLLSGVKHRRFLVFHPAWGYFADEYGLEQIAIESEGKPPGAAALSRLIEQAKREHIHVIFVQRQFSTAMANTVARAINARVVQVDPLAEDYAANLLQFARSLREAMQ